MKKAKRWISTILCVIMMLTVVPMTDLGNIGLKDVFGTEASAATSYIFPVCGTRNISSGYGWRTIDGSSYLHPALDIPGSGLPVVAAKEGTVIGLGNKCWHWSSGYNGCEHNNDYGNYIKIRHADGTEAIYGHIMQNSMTVKINDSVRAGQQIARVGSAGASSGPHLHFEVRAKGYSWSNKVYINTNPGNVSYTYISNPSIAVKYSVYNLNATNITNNDATIGMTISPSVTPTQWGFYFGTSKNLAKDSWREVKSNNLTCNVASYTGELKPGTTYYYRFSAYIGGKWVEAKDVYSFTTAKVAPGEAKLSIADDSSNIGIGDAPTITWKSASAAVTYSAVLYDDDGNTVQRKDNIAKSATSFTFDPINEEGVYKAYLYAVNTVGKTEGKPVATITVHPDVTVTFVDAAPSSFADYDPQGNQTAEVLKTKTVHYGDSVDAPAIPSHEGYTFTGWSEDLTSIKEDTVVTAEYKINSYKVTFLDENGKEIETQQVDYYSDATPPSYTPVKTGYTFTGWSHSLEKVKGDMRVMAVTKWYNDNYSVYPSITTASRDSDNNGYDITVSITNNETKLSTGRIVVALKTSENKLLTSTESAAFSIKAGAVKSFDIFVPYENAAKYAYVYVVDSYNNMIPISQEVSKEIDNGLAWTSWSTEKPVSGTYDELESRVEYRYKTRSNTTSYETSIDGWTRDGYTLVQASNGNIDYVASWPSGFATHHTLYKQYNKTPVAAGETDTTKTTVSTSTIGYLYYHWIPRRSDITSESNRYIGHQWSEKLPNGYQCWDFEAFFSSTALTYQANIDAYTAKGHSNYSWYWVAWDSGSTQLPVKRCTYTTYNKLYNYYKISDFSEWQTEMPNTYEDGSLETRTVYRYRPKDNSVEDTSGQTRTVSGKLDSSYANQQLTLYVYKIDEASDYSNEFLGQTTVTSDGSYSFTFKLREEPTVKTGNYTVAIGIEGANSLIYLDPIEAPDNTYTVRYFDSDGTLISTQTVKEGENAELPATEPEKVGYTFCKWSDSNVNIRSDKDIYAEYKINEYTVVFVDWEARTVNVKKFEHGASLVAPNFEVPDDGISVVWDKIADGVTTVTQDMIVCTEYSEKTYNVTFYDWNNEMITSQTVKHGYAPDVPTLDEGDTYIFLGWQDVETGAMLEDYVVTSRIDVCPKYVFAETCEMPVADVESGEYTTEQTITLTTATDKAVIYYTLDGSDPKGENALEYREAIVVKDYAHLRYYACALNMNDSMENENLYVINPEETTSDYMLYEDLPSYVVEDASKYNVQLYEGYQFKDTVAVTDVDEYESYLSDGWAYESSLYSEWTELQDEEIVKDDAKIDFQIEEVMTDYEVTTASYKYNRFKYTVDGVTTYSNAEVDGFEGEWEYAEVSQSEGYTVGFTNGILSFTAPDGSIWYNRTTGTLIQTLQKAQYRSRYLVVTLYKWAEDVSLERDPNETREFRVVNLFTYDYEKHYIVSIVPTMEFTDPYAKSIIVPSNSLITAEDAEEFYGYTFNKFYKDVEKTSEWDLSTDTVTENITLYADYTTVKFNVTFAYHDGTEIETQQVEYLAAAIPPESIPLPDDYIFLGWDTDAYECVQSELVVKARYIAESEYSTVTLDKVEANLLAETQLKLTAETSVGGKDLVWHSSDESVAIVDSNGVVTGISEGEVVITVTVSDSGEKAECKVIVYKNSDAQLCFVTNSSLGTDEDGNIREIKVDTNTVAMIKSEFANTNITFTDINGEGLSDNDLVGTGTVISLVSDGEVIDSANVIMTGDVTGDGRINNRDAAMITRYLVGKEDISDLQISAIDVNGDGNFNNRDAAMISRYLVGKEVI